MNNEQQELLDEAYKNYLFTSEWFPISGVGGGFIGTKANSDEIMTQGLFINICKTDNEFAKTWGLKIEERELSLDEREDLKLKLILDYLKKNGIISSTFEDFKNDEKLIPNIDWRREVWGLIGWIDYGNSIQTSRLEEIYDGVKHIPAKQITLTYQNESIQFYE
jgi:hypothetical protein